MLPADRALAEELAARAAVTIDNVLAYKREAEVAARLAASLLPSSLPEIDGVELAAAHQVGSETFEVGGDFYDVWPESEDSFFLMVGDVQGKGIEAAAVTSFARYTVKAVSLGERSPARLLERLNQALVRQLLQTTASSGHSWEDARLCTCLLIRLDRVPGAGWSAIVSSAGHPLPVLRTSSGAVETVGSSGLLLGVDARYEYVEATVAIAPGSCLVAFTDGVDDWSSGSVGGVPADVLRRAAGGARAIVEAVRRAAPSDTRRRDDLVVLTACFG